MWSWSIRMWTAIERTLIAPSFRGVPIKRIATLLLAMILATAACSNTDSAGSTGGDGNSGVNELTADETKAVAKIERGYPSSDWFDGEDPTEVHCLALGLVTDFGIDKLQKYGVVDANLEFDQTSSKPMSAPDAALFVDTALGCAPGDFAAVMAEALRADSPNMSDSKVKRCAQAVTEDDERRAMEGYLQEDSRPVAAFYNKLHKAGCGPAYSD
jgi:hypothetical protein